MIIGNWSEMGIGKPQSEMIIELKILKSPMTRQWVSVNPSPK